MTNYIKYWNNAEEVVYWFREWGFKARLVHNEIEWSDGTNSGYMKVGQTAVAYHKWDSVALTIQ